MASLSGETLEPDDADLVQPATRLLHSALWDLQRGYYDSAGAAAWSTGAVPSWITTNAFAAHSVATALLHAWRDLADVGELDTSRRVVILELGAGDGRFALHMLTEVLQRCSLARVHASRILYIATDFTSSNVHAWLRNDRLAALVAAGNLDFGLLDAGKADIDLNRVPLWHAGAPLSQADLDCNPVFVIANYVFDSLPCDAFQVVKPLGSTGPGALREVQLRLRKRSTAAAEVTCNDLNFEWLPAHELGGVPTRYYATDAAAPAAAVVMDAALDWYRNHVCDESLPTAFQVDLVTAARTASYVSVDDLNTPAAVVADGDNVPETAMFPLPVAALRVLSALESSTRAKGFMLLAFDKGISSPAAYTRSHVLDVQQHGSVSFMLNFHALLLWAKETVGGFGFVSRSDDVNLKLACIGRFNRIAPSGDMPLFMDTLQRMCNFSASEFYDLQAAVCAAAGGGPCGSSSGDDDDATACSDGGGSISVRGAVALCALSEWDADVYHGVRSVLEARFRFLSPPRRATIMRGLRHMCDRWCDDGRVGADAAFEAARMLQCGGEHAGAARMYAQSLARSPHHAAAFNLGMCAMDMGAPSMAAQAFAMAAALHAQQHGPGRYELAEEMRERAAAQLEEAKGQEAAGAQ